MQASCSLHSELTRHSGRQDGGDPIWPGRHEQAAAPLALTVHSLYGPHGDGEQGDIGLSAQKKNTSRCYNLMNNRPATTSDKGLILSKTNLENKLF